MNTPTIIVCLILAAVVSLILVYMHRSKKNGTSCSCGSSCTSCTSCSSCNCGCEVNAEQEKNKSE